ALHGRGYGKSLLDWLKLEAARQGCDNLHLDSGTQRLAAHAFYFAQNMKISSFHFVVDVEKSAS
ncbi:MAG: GNAT family N-acetyltransferase, partial [Arenimonas sp.]